MKRTKLPAEAFTRAIKNRSCSVSQNGRRRSSDTQLGKAVNEGRIQILINEKGKE